MSQAINLLKMKVLYEVPCMKGQSKWIIFSSTGGFRYIERNVEAKCRACFDCSWENLSAQTSICLYMIQDKERQNHAKAYFISGILDYFSAPCFSHLVHFLLYHLSKPGKFCFLNRKGSVLSHAFSDRLILFRCDFQLCNEIILN